MIVGSNGGDGWEGSVEETGRGGLAWEHHDTTVIESLSPTTLQRRVGVRRSPSSRGRNYHEPHNTFTC